MTLREEFVDQLIDPASPPGLALPLSGVDVVPYLINDDGTEQTTAATAHAFRVGNPFALAGTQTNNEGVVDYFLDVGNYNIHYSDPNHRIPDYVRQFTAITAESLTDISTILDSVDFLLANQVAGDYVSRTVAVPITSASYVIVDSIPNVVIENPTDLIAVWYQANWTFGGIIGGAAAIFIDNNQLRVPMFNSSQTQAAAHLGFSNPEYITSTAHGLMGISNGPYNDITAPFAQSISATAQAHASSTAQELNGSQVKAGQGQIHGGPCFIEAAPGSHIISVRYKSSVGHTMTALASRFRAAVIKFPSS